MNATHTLAICGMALALLASSCHNEADAPAAASRDVLGFSATMPGDTLKDFTVYGYLDGRLYMSAEVSRQQGAWTYSPACYWPDGGRMDFHAVTQDEEYYASATMKGRPANNIVELRFSR